MTLPMTKYANDTQYATMKNMTGQCRAWPIPPAQQLTEQCKQDRISTGLNEPFNYTIVLGWDIDPLQHAGYHLEWEMCWAPLILHNSWHALANICPVKGWQGNQS